MGRNNRRSRNKNKNGKTNDSNEKKENPKDTLWSLYYSAATMIVYQLLAMGGYFDSQRFSLDDYDDEEQLDKLLEAMNFQEKRIEFQQAITKLMDVLNDNEPKQTLGTGTDEAKFLKLVEEAAYQLNTVMKLYQQNIIHQRYKIVEYQEEVKKLKSIASIEAKKILTETLFFVKLLSDQYRRQLDLETKILDEISIFMQSSLYYDNEEELRETEDESFHKFHQDHFESLSKLRRKKIQLQLKQWIFLLKKKVCLQKCLWDTNIKGLLKNLSRHCETDSVLPPESEVINEYHTNVPFQTTHISQSIGSIDSTLKHRLINCKSISTAMDIFFMDFSRQTKENDASTGIDKGEYLSTKPCEMKDQRHVKISTSFILLTGPSSTGKSHFIDSMYEKVISLKETNEPTSKAKFEVIRPRLPVDIMGSTVGSSENSLISLFNYAKISALKDGKCLVLLDDLEHIVGESSDALLSNAEHPMKQSLLQSLFITLMNRYQFHLMSQMTVSPYETVDIVFLCSAKNISKNLMERFDKVFTLGMLNELEIQSILKGFLFDHMSGEELSHESNKRAEIGNHDYSSVEELFTEVSKCLAGRTVGEVSQFCRNMLLMEQLQSKQIPDNNIPETIQNRLMKLKHTIHSSNPESIKSGNLSGIVDINILTSKELHSNTFYSNDNGLVDLKLPLIGDNVESSWKDLENLIIVPLCRSGDLNDLLFGNCVDYAGNPQKSPKMITHKTVCSGVLLTGQPGCGKTSLAYHCAAVAAGINPSIRLIDVSCTSLVKKEVGGSEKAVKHLFEAARLAAPCIVLLEGIENIAPVRGNDNTTEGTMDRILSTLLTEMDGIGVQRQQSETDDSINSGNDSIAVIGVTHNPDWVDAALRRPGRLEKCITLELPDMKSREMILQRRMVDMDIKFCKAGYFDPKNKQELASTLAMRTNGRSAADLLAICNDALMLSVTRALELYDNKESNKNDEQEPIPVLTYQEFLTCLDNLH